MRVAIVLAVAAAALAVLARALAAPAMRAAAYASALSPAALTALGFIMYTLRGAVTPTLLVAALQPLLRITVIEDAHHWRQLQRTVRQRALWCSQRGLDVRMRARAIQGLIVCRDALCWATPHRHERDDGEFVIYALPSFVEAMQADYREHEEDADADTDAPPAPRELAVAPSDEGVADESLPQYVRVSASMESPHMDRVMAPWPTAARDSQAPIVAAIVAAVGARRRATHRFQGLTVLISGASGCGKTTIGALVARSLHATISLALDPIAPGDLLDVHLDRVAPTPSEPHVVVINEWDSTLRAVLRGTPPRSATLRQEITSIESYNNFLDSVQRRWNIVLVLTSVMSREQIAAEAKAALGRDVGVVRDGRIHLAFDMGR